MPHTSAFHTLAAYGAWENDGLYTILETAPGALAVEEAPIMLAILNHAYTVSRIFQAHILGETHPYRSANPEPLPFDELAANVRATDRWYVDYARAAKAAELDERVDFRFTSGEPGCMSRGEMVLHVVNHGTYHRGNVGVILLKNGIPVPSGTAGLTDFLAVERELKHASA